MKSESALLIILGLLGMIALGIAINVCIWLLLGWLLSLTGLVESPYIWSAVVYVVGYILNKARS